MKSIVNIIKKNKLGGESKILAILFLVVMLLSVGSVLALSMLSVFAQDDELVVDEGEPFSISVDTLGKECYLVLPKGLTLNNSSEFETTEDGTLILNSNAELSLTAVVGNYTLQTTDSEKTATGKPLSFTVVAAETDEKITAKESKAINAIYPQLEMDEAYVSKIAVTAISDGTGPWDANNNPGNDMDDTNKIVRSFDTVRYTFNVEMSSYSTASSPAFSEVYVKLEFVLPVTSEEAGFDTNAMAWMSTDAAHKWTVTTETRNIDGIDTNCQVLTCYKYLVAVDGGVPNVVPGDFSETVVINVKAMENGDDLEPLFSAAMEYNTWNGTCPEHNTIEKKTITANPVKVSAAPKYNVGLTAALDDASWKGTNDYNTGNTYL